MLDAGFSSLDYLKSRLLPAGGQEITDWDGPLCSLGLAVARKFCGHCSRVFDRTEDQVDEFSAGNTVLVLRAIPVESITSVQIRGFTGALTTFTGGYQLDKSAGLMIFQNIVGVATERIVVTYDGGFWLDDYNPMPTGATPLPDDLLEAWVMQCQAWADARNLFGTVSLSGGEKSKPSISSAALTDEVASMLAPYRRYSGE